MPRKPKATIHNVAQLAGVSIATVSNALSGRKPVTPAVVKKVTEAARTLDYQVNRAAAQLRSGEARVVGVVVPNFNDTFFTSLVSRIELLAAKAAYQVIVVSSHDDATIENARLDALMGWRPTGIIAVPTTNTVPRHLRGRHSGIPIVLVDRVRQENQAVDTVAMDNHAAGWSAASHLLDFGHRSIAIASSITELWPIRERIRGVAECCAANGAPEPRVVEVGVAHEPGADIMADWLKANPHPTAIVAMTNVTTLATLAALVRQGIRVPQAISLIGFDDYTWMTARNVPLTAVRQPIDSIVDTAWSFLNARVNGEDGPPRHLSFEASLQMRASVARIGGG